MTKVIIKVKFKAAEKEDGKITQAINEKFSNKLLNILQFQE